MIVPSVIDPAVILPLTPPALPERVGTPDARTTVVEKDKPSMLADFSSIYTVMDSSLLCYRNFAAPQGKS